MVLLIPSHRFLKCPPSLLQFAACHHAKAEAPSVYLIALDRLWVSQTPCENVWSFGTDDTHGKELCRLNSFWCEERCSSFRLNLLPDNLIFYHFISSVSRVHSTGSAYSVCIHPLPDFVGSHQITFCLSSSRMKAVTSLRHCLYRSCLVQLECLLLSFVIHFGTFSSLLYLSVAGMSEDHMTQLSGHGCIDTHSGRVVDSGLLFPNNS